jgi:hypothetical protein
VDIKSAFLYSALPEDQVIYLLPPKGYARSGYLIKLERSSYGLKQAPYLWSQTLHKELYAFGLQASAHDASLFFSLDKRLYVAVHVDDLTITGPDESIAELTAFLRSKFTLQTDVTITDLLGMTAQYDRLAGVLTLCQEEKVTSLLDSMSVHVGHLPRKSVPANPVAKLKVPDPADLEAFRSQMQHDHGKNWEKVAMPYRSIVGSIQHVMVMTRPDLTFATSYLSRFMSCFTFDHWKEALRSLQYLKQCPARQIVISSSKLKDFTLSAWCDSDWASSDLSERRSCSGFIIFLGQVPILWKSQLQSKTALSSGEAEFVALSEVTRHVLTLRHVMAELGFSQDRPTPVYGDATAALQALKAQKCDSKLKHVETRFHRTRQEIALGTILPIKVDTKVNISDAFTKALRSDSFNSFMAQIFDGPETRRAKGSS